MAVAVVKKDVKVKKWPPRLGGKDVGLTKVGRTLRVARVQLGWTQSVLASKLGVHTQFVSNIELGLTPLPPKKLRIFAKKLSLDVNVLVAARVWDFKHKLLEQVGV